jgi:peptide/nickel transport system substrate-binding protein
MLRGFRWQLLVFLMALALFAVSFLSRLTTPDQPPAIEPTPVSLSPSLPPPTSTPDAPPQPLDLPPSGTAQSLPTYREALIGTVQRLNPLFADLNPVDRDITSLIFEGLTRTNAYGEPEAALAKSWIISPNGLEYVVQLRDDVLWQDGIPFTAADVIYTLSLLQSTDFPGDARLAAFWRTVEVQQLDDYQIRFRLTQPLGSFLDALRIGILPEHALRGTTAAQIAAHPFNLSPIGTGAYQLEALRTGGNNQITVVDLRVAPVYRARPEGGTGYGLERLSFRLYPTFDEALAGFKAAEVDALAGRNRAERSALVSTGANVHTAVEPSLGVIIFNWAKDSTRFFREQRVRIALQTGLDRSSLIDRYLTNQVVQANSPLLPGSWAYLSDLQWPIPDANVARSLLENASIRLPTPEAPAEGEATPEVTATTGLFSFTILTPDDPALVNVAQEIAAQWSQLNIAVRVEAVDLATYLSRLDSSDFDAALVELSLGDSADPDVYQFWHQGQYPDGANYGGVDDRQVAEDLERARRDPSGINRIIHYQSFQREFIERAIAIPLYYPLYTYVTAPQVSGVQLGFIGSPASRFYSIKDWTIPPAG